jgi:hypothetical protein
MKLLKFISILLLFGICSCQNKTEKHKLERMENNNWRVLLEKQIKAGYAAEKSETDYPNYTFTETDLNLSSQILKEYLIKNGYKIPDNETFNEMVNKIFQRSLDYNSEKNNIYINFANPCDREIIFLKNNSEEIQDYSFYLNKQGNFITELFSIPEILDYEKSFPEIIEFENKIPTSKNDVTIYKWNSLKNLKEKREINLKKILARNKFLFNKSEADLVWLLFNDKRFLIDLVAKFGFDKEMQINKMALETLYKEYQSQIPNQIQKIGSLFFLKNCDGKLSVRDGLLEYVKETTNEKDNRLIYALSNYATILYNGDKDHVFDDDPSKIFNELQKANIVAIIASIENPAIDKFKYRNPELWNNAGSSLYNLLIQYPEIKDIIVKNNYFGIKNMKQVLEDTVIEINIDNFKRSNNKGDE